MFLNHLERSPQCARLLRQSPDGTVHALHAPALSKHDWDVMPQDTDSLVSRRLDKVCKKDRSEVAKDDVERLRHRPSDPVALRPLDPAYGEAALHERAYRGDWTYQANRIGDTPISLACELGHTDVVERLIASKKVNVNQANRNGDTPLYVACENGHKDHPGGHLITVSHRSTSPAIWATRTWWPFFSKTGREMTLPCCRLPTRALLGS
jgi:hypothetical protein